MLPTSQQPISASSTEPSHAAPFARGVVGCLCRSTADDQCLPTPVVVDRVRHAVAVSAGYRASESSAGVGAERSLLTSGSQAPPSPEVCKGCRCA